MSKNILLAEVTNYLQAQIKDLPGYLSSEQKNVAGKPDDWSPKDNIFHCLVWAERRGKILAALEKDGEWKEIDYGDDDTANLEIWEEHQHNTWDDAQKMADEIYDWIADYLKRADLDTLDLVNESDQRTVWRSIADNYILHPMIHLWELLLGAGQLDTVVSTFGAEYAGMLREIDSSEGWLGGIEYNLACVHALSGQSDLAIKALGKALQMVPGLIEWSRQDSDLDSIRSHPEYESLYEGLEGS